MAEESLGVFRELGANTPPNVPKSWVCILAVPGPQCQGSFLGSFHLE